jgi:hypothetical protein
MPFTRCSLPRRNWNRVVHNRRHHTSLRAAGAPERWPSSLNFAYNGTITIDGNSYQLVVGQGKNGVHNNWWIGGNQWSSDTESLITPDNKYRITQMDVSFNELSVQPK